MSAVTERPRATRRLANEFPNRVRPSKFAHVVLTTPNLPRARQWYLNLFDARVAYENDTVCFLTYDDEHHRIGLIAMPNLVERPPNSFGLEHMAYSFQTLGALLSQYQYLKSQGITPFWTINHGPTISFYYRDPDGNKVEMDYDVFPTVAETNAFFSAGHYAKNFMGIIVDPEELIAKYEAGAPLSELVERPPLPPGKTPWDMYQP
ncbi:MAG TPA: VOC family protein [Steroidobacteraceae bacterium]|nr:VOC family protein [Steroidobacteraceae bacterium]